MTDLPPPPQPSDRLTVADTYQEQRVSPVSHLDLPSLTVTLVYSGDSAISPMSKVSSELEEEFRTLAEEWYMETMPLSSYIEKILHPAYQRILVLGKPAVPLIINELRDMPNDWFWALRIITRRDPVDSSIAGRLDLMAEAWIKWWEQEDPTLWAQHSS